jgi:hypothetical protein
MECSYIKIILGSTKKEVKFLVILEIGMEVIIGTQILKDWEIKIDFEEENISINREKLLIEIQRKGKQWTKLIYSTMLQSEQWIQVKIEVLKGELNIIWKIEASRGMNLKNCRYIIPGIIGDNNCFNVWMKDKDKIPRILYVRTKVAQVWEDKIVRKIDGTEKIENQQEEKGDSIEIDLITNSNLIEEQQ